jgi:ABC-type sugar transport system substrate-binding protein
MLHFLADENFNNNIVTGLLRRIPDVDIVRAQNVGLTGAADQALLAWAAEAKRIILTHDAATLPDLAFQRQASGLLMAGVFVVSWQLPYRAAIDDLVLLNDCSDNPEWEERVLYLPLR